MGDKLSGKLQVLAVLPIYEGKGFGSALLKQVQNWLKTYPNPAYSAYQHHGWSPTGEISGKDGIFVLQRT